jgi:transposase-like protein
MSLDMLWACADAAIITATVGRRMYMWRAVDSEGEVLDMLVQPRRDKAAALKLVKKLLKRQGFAPTVVDHHVFVVVIACQ